MTRTIVDVLDKWLIDLEAKSKDLTRPANERAALALEVKRVQDDKVKKAKDDKDKPPKTEKPPK